jgi:hypothetical protein
VASVGGEGDRKGNTVVIRDLEGGGCSEINRRTASIKDEVKPIACLVSGKRLGTGQVKSGKEREERVREKFIEGRRREVEVAEYEDR